MTKNSQATDLSSDTQTVRTPRIILVFRVLLIAIGWLSILAMFFPFLLAILFRPATALHFLGLAAAAFAAATLTRKAGFSSRIVALITMLIGLALAYDGRRLYERAHFFLVQSTYVEALPGLLADEDEACPATWCAVDLGPPPVVFFQSGGYVGGQWGVCYDPSGVTLTPRSERAGEEWDRSNIYLLREKTFSYAKLRDDWYLCSS